jgi:hypothetical protein
VGIGKKNKPEKTQSNLDSGKMRDVCRKSIFAGSYRSLLQLSSDMYNFSGLEI